MTSVVKTDNVNPLNAAAVTMPAVNITGGSVTGITDLAVADGGTGASTASGALTNLGVSAFAQTVLDDTDATAARTTLDVPSNSEAVLDTIIDAKGDLIVGTADNTPARKAVGSNGQIIVADSTQSDGLIWTDFWRDPLNINPNWILDQANGGSAVTVSGAQVAGPDSVTGWATGAGAFTLQKVADPDNAALSCLKVACTTADSSIGATDAYRLYWGIEGFDCASLMAGTASAQSITIQFKAKSNSVTGVFGIAVQNNVANRRYVGTINIPDTNENSYSVTLQLDTSGTWQYGNLGGLFVYLTLAAGSNFHATAGSWGAGGEYTTSAQANFMSANTNILYIKRFHIIPGNVVLAYKPSDMQRELARAQRQYERGGTQIDITNEDQGFRASYSGSFVQNVRYAVTKRAAATVTVFARSSGSSAAWRDDSAVADLAASIYATNISGFLTSASTTDGNFYSFTWVANARLS